MALRFTEPYKSERVYSYWLPRITLLEITPLTHLLDDRRDLIVADVGAMRGLWSRAFLDVLGDRTSAVHLFEPLATNVRNMERMRADGFFRPYEALMSVNNVALGADSGRMKLFFDREITGLASLIQRESRFLEKTFPLGKETEVEIISLDHYCAARNLEEIDVLKIDTEGYEKQVLLGASELLRKKRIFCVVFEFGVHQLAERNIFKDYWELFDSSGYDMFEVEAGDYRTRRISRYSTQYETFQQNYAYLARAR